MGLDMYLYASRTFDPASEEAQQIVATAGTTISALEELAKKDPREHSTSIYLSYWQHEDNQTRQQALATLHAAGLTPLASGESSGGDLSMTDQGLRVQITSLYWRKANAIHAWFVENCQDGVDECQVSDDIDYELLASLAATCTKAVEAYDAGDFNKAGQLLTPTSGFFFGSTEIDSWWADDVRKTAVNLERMVTKAIEIGGVSFQYHSSW